MHSQVPGLQGVDEGHPDNVTKGKHHSETVSCDVHGGQDGWLVPPRVKDVDGLDQSDADGAVGNVAVVAVLLRTPGAVEDDPTHHARSELQPLLEVDLANQGDDNPGVQLAANEPVVQHVARVPSRGELAVLLVSRLDAEAPDVDKGGHGVREDGVGGQDLDEVVRDEGPDGELGALGCGSGGEDS